MKNLIVLLLVMLIGLPIYSEKKQTKKDYAYNLPTALSKELKNWPVEKLEYLSSVYLELGKRFYELKNEKDSKACFYYSIQVYPIGKPAETAKKYLKKNWDIDIP